MTTIHIHVYSKEIDGAGSPCIGWFDINPEIQSQLIAPVMEMLEACEQRGNLFVERVAYMEKRLGALEFQLASERGTVLGRTVAIGGPAPLSHDTKIVVTDHLCPCGFPDCGHSKPVAADKPRHPAEPIPGDSAGFEHAAGKYGDQLDKPAGDDAAVANVISVLFALRRHGYRDEADLLQKYSESLRANLAQAEHQRDAWKAEKDSAEGKLVNVTADRDEWRSQESEVAKKMRAAEDMNDRLAERVAELEQSQRICGKALSDLGTQLTAMTERAEKALSELVEERNHREKGESIMRELTKQRDALRQEVEALKGRKVDLSDADTCDCGGIHKATVIELIRAAGIAVES